LETLQLSVRVDVRLCVAVKVRDGVNERTWLRVFVEVSDSDVVSVTARDGDAEAELDSGLVVLPDCVGV